MKQFMKEQKTLILLLVLVAVLIGSSYAWLTITVKSTKQNVIMSGSLSLTLDDTASNGINISVAQPITDNDGLVLTPYIFTLKNNGNIASNYTIYLDDEPLETGEEKLLDNYIKYSITKNSTTPVTALLSTTGTNSNRMISNGTINPDESYTYELRLWIDGDATNDAMNKVFRGKLRVEATQTNYNK